MLDPFVGAEHSGSGALSANALFEEAVSLAATICDEWCRESGHQLVLAVGGRQPTVLGGTTSASFRQRLLECLATVSAEREAAHGALIAALPRRRLPRAAVLVIGIQANATAQALSTALRRAVAAVELSGEQVYDFYERVPAHAP